MPIEGEGAEKEGEHQGTQKTRIGVALDDTGVTLEIAEADATLEDFGTFSFRKNAAAFALPLINYTGSIMS